LKVIDSNRDKVVCFVSVYKAIIPSGQVRDNVAGWSNATPELIFKLNEWPKAEGREMEFTLVYDGPLYGAGTNASHKHDIRRQFHPQLKAFWKARLSHWLKAGIRTSATAKTVSAGGPVVGSIGEHYAMFGFRFVPLVTEDLKLACKLDILFLRRDTDRSIIKSGDIDNRLKTLFDALRNPHNQGELGGHSPAEGEEPFYTLLEDDKLITEVRVSSDMLLTPIDPKEPHLSKLIIGVHLRPFQHTDWNADFW
jgi:hypothetical protein